EILGLIKTAVTRMNGMIEQVLVTSKLESGRFVFGPVAAAVPALLAQVVAELGQANPQATRIAVQCQGLEERRLVDPQLLRHIVINLLGNALKYSPAGSAVTCAVSA